MAAEGLVGQLSSVLTQCIKSEKNTVATSPGICNRGSNNNGHRGYLAEPVGNFPAAWQY